MPALQPTRRRTGVPDGASTWTVTCSLYSASFPFFRLVVYAFLVSLRCSSSEGAAPVFAQSVWRGNVTENTAVGTSVLRMEATDADGDTIEYSMWGGKNHNHFSVAYSTGIISISQSIDREKIPSYFLTVSATDYVHFVQASVIITVQDVNDNSPSCDYATIMVTLSEAAEVGTGVTSVNCTDADSGPNGRLSYRIASGNAYNAFTIHNALGIVKTAKKLDYELTTQYRLVVTVTDMALTTSLQTNVTLLIPIQSANEFAPVFSTSSYETSVMSESKEGFSVLRVTAYDSDKGSDGTVTYKLMENVTHYFTLNESSGDLLLSNALRYDCFLSQNNVFRFLVKAEDHGNPSKSSLANVTMTVTQMNDHKPSCSPGTYATSVPESLQPNSIVLNIVCSDPDGNALTYEIRDDDAFDVFNITESGKLTTRKTLDYEKNSSYNLVIVAKEECVSTPTSATASVTVQVTGVNEYAPSFNARAYNVSVREDATVGTSILSLNATDEDEGNDGVINYWIDQNTVRSTAFLIDRLSGMLILARSLDRETRNIHLLTVEAIDGSQAIDRMTGSTVVNVAVTDSNDNAPACHPSVVVATIEDTALVGSTVATLSCSDLDADSNGRISYQISSGEATNLFTVTPRGDIKTKSSLAHSLPDLFSFPVIVSDHGKPQQVSNASVVVQVRRGRRHSSSPVFRSSNYFAPLFENATIGTTVVTVSALDNRTAIPTRFEYSVVYSDAATVLVIDPISADVVLTNTLDRERKDSYTVVVGVSETDSWGRRVGRTDIATVTVNVTDVNDNAPSCEKQVVTVNVPENAPLFMMIAQLNCFDTDEGENSDLTYTIIHSNSKNNLPIALTSDGKLHVNETLDYESIQSYLLTALVYDGGSPSHQVNVTVIIIVDPVNESPPMFQSTLNISIDEDTFVGTVIARVRATDSDTGTDGEITYTITSYAEEMPFSIEKTTGNVLLIATLDRETVDAYDLTVTATDGGTPPKAATTSMQLTVLDENDNSPVCQQQTLIISLPDVGNATEVASLKCTDSDKGENSQLSYNITTQDDVPFTVDQYGQIRATNGTKDSQLAVYTFSVKVSDQGAPQLTTTVTVIVTVTSTHGEQTPNPFFDRMVTYVDVAENATIGSVLTRLNCTVPSGAAPLFNITKGDASHLFELTLLGHLKVARAIDYEASDRYTLTVACRDSMDISRFESSFVDITVTDVNEFYPVFSQDKMTVLVVEDEDIGTLVIQVEARDEDRDADIRYSIEQAIPDNHPFILDTTNGRISLLRRLDREAVSEYDLNISASDSVHISHTLIRITVSDINDNPPQCRSLLHVVELNDRQTKNTVVGRLNCSDRDVGPNGLLSYKLTGDWSRLFAVNSTNGQLKLVRRISTVQTPRETRLMVVISDQGSPRSLNETVEVVVRFPEKNRYAPDFLIPRPPIFEVNESERLGYRLGQIVARDRDEDALLSTVQYRFSHDVWNRPFFLDPWTGILYLTSPLDRETVDSYTLTIEAVDSGSPIRRTSTTDITVTVRDINDNPPSCNPSVYGSILSTATPSGTTLAKLNCSDVDSGLNAVVQYRILEDTSMTDSFHVNSTGHVILRNNHIDNAKLQLMQLPIVVSDKGTVSLSTSVVVVVRVLEDQSREKQSPEQDRSNSLNEIESEWVANSVEVQFFDYSWKQWITSGRSTAKALFALAATVYCSASPSLCSVMKPVSDKQRNDELVIFKDSNVVISRSKPSTIFGRQQLLVSFYISLPNDVQLLPNSPTSTVVPQMSVRNIVDYAKSSLEASKFTVGNSWPASFVFTTEPVSEMTDYGTLFQPANFTDWEIMAIGFVPVGLMIILAATLLTRLWCRQHRRRKPTPLRVLSAGLPSDIRRQLRKPPSISDTHDLPAITGRTTLSTQRESNFLRVSQNAMILEANETARDGVSSTISLIGSSYRESSSLSSYSGSTVLPGALPSTDDYEQPIPETKTEIPTNDDTDLINRNRDSMRIRRSRILQTLNTKLKLELPKPRVENNGIEPVFSTRRKLPEASTTWKP